MIDLDLLKSRKIDPDGLREKLSKEPFRTIAERTDLYKEPTTEEGKRNELRNRIRLRIQAGRDNNIANHKTYAAVDRAWDVPFQQVTPTLMQSFMDRSITDAQTGQVSRDVLDAVKAWGLNADDLFMDVEDPKTPGKTIKKVNYPTFFIIHVPILKAYLTIRLAKLMNDRKLQPLFKYEPAINNMATRMKCDVITNRIGDVMARQYGYWNLIRQCEFQALLYGWCLQFPMEEWHSEEQEVEGSTPADSTASPPTTNGEKKKPKRKTRVVKEGVRGHPPHPSRTFFDEAHRISTFNTDTGCEFGGYWKVMRFRDLRNNPGFYNTDKVSIGNTEWWSSASTFFNAVYNQCVIKVPQVVNDSSDRETKLIDQPYSQTHDDASVIVTEYFEKLIPSENGLGDYDYPVWFRFVVAGDDCILYAAPLPYCPIVAYLYDPDENRAQEKNASLALELLPFQDHMSNLFSQYLLSVKQNLMNVTFVDEHALGKDGSKWMERLQNWGERMFRSFNFIKFDSKHLQRQQTGVVNAFYSHRFPPMNTQEIAQAMKMILEILERVQQYSSQEVAQAASHELREKEVINIQQATSTRLEYTAAPLDFAIEAFKMQLYQATMAYGQDEFYAQIPVDPQVTKDQLEAMGFTWDEKEHPRMKDDRNITVKVKDKRTAIALESFAAAKDGPNRGNSREEAAQLLQVISMLMQTPFAPNIGAEQFLMMINLTLQMGGFPKEFKLDNAGSPQQQMEQVKGMLQQELMPMIQQAMGPVHQEMAQLDQQQQVDIEALKANVAQVLQTLGLQPMVPNADHDNAPPNPAQLPEEAGANRMALPTGGAPV